MTKLDDLHYDLHERIREADPARGLKARPLTDSDLTHEIDAILGSGAFDEARPIPMGATVALPVRRRRRVTMVAASVALAAAVAGTPVAMQMLNATGDGRNISAVAPGSSASEVLEQTAANVPADPATTPGQYWQITYDLRFLARGEADHRDMMGKRTEYVPVGGSTRRFISEAAYPVLSDGSMGPAASTSVYSPSVERENVPGIAWEDPTATSIDAMPRDVHALREHLFAEARAGQKMRVEADPAVQQPSVEAEAFGMAAHLLFTGRIPADLRASTLRVIETIPGVEVRETSVAIGDRTGVAIGRGEARRGLRDELIVDPDSGTVLGLREIVAGVTTAMPELEGMSEGTVYMSAVMSRAVVDEVPEQIREEAVRDHEARNSEAR